MPTYDPTTDKAIDFQFTFLCSDKAQVALEMLTKNNFLPTADVATKRYTLDFFKEYVTMRWILIGLYFVQSGFPHRIENLLRTTIDSRPRNIQSG